MVTTYEAGDGVAFENTGFIISTSQVSRNVENTDSDTYGYGWALDIPDDDPDDTVEMVLSDIEQWSFTSVETMQDGGTRAADRIGFVREHLVDGGVEYEWHLDTEANAVSEPTTIEIAGTTYEFTGVERLDAGIYATDRSEV